VGNEERSIKDLIDYQESRRKTSSFQKGKKNEVVLSKSIGNLEVISDRRGTLTKEEDKRSIMIIGGINIFLPGSLVKANACVEGAVEGGQPSDTFMEEIEKTIKSTQEMEKEEHSSKLLKSCIHGDE
jgi:hypothetical protein